MAKPEPTPVVKGREAEELLRKLDTHEFVLTPAQRKLLSGAKDYYARHQPKQ
jgi:hypothetical protein